MMNGSRAPKRNGHDAARPSANGCVRIRAQSAWIPGAAEAWPKPSVNRVTLAACQALLGEDEQAEEILRAVLSEHPAQPMANYHLGRVLQSQGKPREAQAAYRLELECCENNVPARFALGDLLLQQGDLAGYRDQMEHVVAIAPDRAKGYFLLARAVLSDTSDLDRAETLIDAGLALADTASLEAQGHRLRAEIDSRRQPKAAMRGALG